ncbi:SPOR domain-containing protein [Teredinibacter sp. KSP-S5-2]|uniref:SPOR domain-containing protein n=1 Tax=Teredinibacter sp. KSP-S5-2 TaxID=3034506 RepID=UPI002934357A|nr:SPOR domain-containing protein [Teredinibacter sp. KSP-S5-2]WNO09688.1 SPOR domain-containing protein [Teredinibacter sp. KSP-S5-2]
MRWIFISLMVANLAVFAWGMVFDSDEHASQPARKLAKRDPFPNIDEIKLLSEVDIPAAPVDMAADELSELSGPEVIEKPSKPICEIVGAFPGREQADNFVERLRAYDVQSELKELDLPVGEGYWVYLEPEATRKEAYRRLSEIQARGVDSYVIPKGELENGISLGVYSKESLAQDRFKKMKALGLEPKFKTIERTQREFWVMLKHGEGLKMSNLSWERVIGEEKSLQRRQNFCLDVASQDNFH